MPFYNGTAANNTIYGSSGDDSILGQGGSDTLYGGDGNDNIIDNDGQNPDLVADSLNGEGGNDTIYAGYLDSANGGSGTDSLILRLDYAPGAVTIDFTALWTGGTYTIGGATIRNFEKLFWATGTQYGDTMVTGSPAGQTSELTGLAGADTLGGGAGNDILGGDLYYRTTITNDIWYDIMIGSSGNDRLFGGVGDYFDGGTGSDALGFDAGLSSSGVLINFTTLLSSGTDTILGSYMTGIEDIEWAYGSQYDDTIDASYDQTAITLAGRGGNDVLATSAGNDTLYGGVGNDTLFAGNGLDSLYGEDGDDILYASGGNDSIYGGIGNDSIYGSVGLDTMEGGTGADIFYFVTGDIPGTTSTTTDRITDFNQGQGDRLNLAGIDAIAGGGDNSFTFVGTSGFSSSAGQLRYSSSGGITMVYGDTNGDGAADFAIRLDGTVSLVAGDFVL